MENNMTLGELLQEMEEASNLFFMQAEQFVKTYVNEENENNKIEEKFEELNDNLAVIAKHLLDFSDSELLLHSEYTPDIEERINDCLAALGYAVMGFAAIQKML